jgi:hypothetical protein
MRKSLTTIPRGRLSCTTGLAAGEVVVAGGDEVLGKLAFCVGVTAGLEPDAAVPPQPASRKATKTTVALSMDIGTARSRRRLRVLPQV